MDDILECTLVRPKPPVLAGVNPRRGLAIAGGSQQHKGGGTARSRAGTSRPLRGEGDEEWHRSMPFIQRVDNKQVGHFLSLWNRFLSCLYFWDHLFLVMQSFVLGFALCWIAIVFGSFVF